MRTLKTGEFSYVRPKRGALKRRQCLVFRRQESAGPGRP